MVRLFSLRKSGINRSRNVFLVVGSGDVKHAVITELLDYIDAKSRKPQHIQVFSSSPDTRLRYLCNGRPVEPKLDATVLSEFLVRQYQSGDLVFHPDNCNEAVLVLDDCSQVDELCVAPIAIYEGERPSTNEFETALESIFGARRYCHTHIVIGTSAIGNYRRFIIRESVGYVMVCRDNSQTGREQLHAAYGRGMPYTKFCKLMDRLTDDTCLVLDRATDVDTQCSIYHYRAHATTVARREVCNELISVPAGRFKGRLLPDGGVEYQRQLERFSELN